MTEPTKPVKFDKEKLDLTIVPPMLEPAACRALMYGAKKYARFNYREVEDGPQRYFAAMERHIKQYKAGEETDRESGLHHLDHVAACLAILLEYRGMGQDIGSWRAFCAEDPT
jgi:hypothetical protein